MDHEIRQLSTDETKAAIKADARAAADKGLLATACPYGDRCSDDHSTWLSEFYDRVQWLSGEQSE